MAKFKYVWNYMGRTLKEFGAAISPYITSGGGLTPDANGNVIIADTSSYPVIVADGGTQLIDNFSGMLIVNDHWDGRVETWICGGSGTLLLGYTSSGAGVCNSTLTMSGGGYEWTNVDNLGSNGAGITFTVIKTRSGS